MVPFKLFVFFKNEQRMKVALVSQSLERIEDYDLFKVVKVNGLLTVT
jgi:hypothetical protein